MKYLDEEINMKVSGWSTISADSTYPYYVDTQLPIANNDEWENVFVGNCFISTNDTYKTITINDIVENHKWIKNDLSLNVGAGITGLLNKWRVRIIVAGITYTSNVENVVTAYRYPFAKTIMRGYIPSLDNIDFVNFLQGFATVTDKSLQLYPTIPYGVGLNYLFRFVYGHKVSADYILYNLYIRDKKLAELETFNNTYITVEMTLDADSLNNFDPTEDDIKDGDILWIGGYKDHNITKLFDIGKIQICSAPYYLLWQDRYGGMQSQPFNKVITYSEDITYTSLVDERNRTYYINSEISPKWRINSPWINQKYYPYYESIYCSPYVKLYITETNTLIDVLVDSSDYVEKTFDNQSKNLFNLTLDLSATQTQKILH